MSYAQLLTLVLLGCLLSMCCHTALAYDVVCKSSKDGEALVVHSPSRSYMSTSTLESGLQRTIKVKDVVYGSEVDDYVSYYDGKYRVSYSLKCEML